MEPLMGEIKLFAGNFAPNGWFSCEGQLLPISQYTALFSLLGTTYGGNGSNTFALPDLRGTVPLGYASIGGTPPSGLSLSLGQVGGSTTSPLSGGQLGGGLTAAGNITIGANNLPSHTHTATATATTSTVPISIPTNNTTGPGAKPSGNYIGVLNDATGAAPNIYATTSDGTSLAAFNATAAAPTVTVTNASTGSGAALAVSLPVTGSAAIAGTVSTVQPYLAMIYIIAWNGVYPSRP
jgi:microcystin-dependent protein